ncbi:tRNA (adenosine(37)-N6)-dimethylallyltransferase MiaA [Alpinimonas psychrophila]|uniref:tRNA dimethylallyltransferase n=1 Tax=Alpinimonas psychrophila TaxID=748908 RepID=A0A7W3PP05_9MICO|nr:tRNA (adenosine(37)-N6)-dimethylallyltransferase MiaA [Alpinimonas psychrophila]MBA8828738.1 tRNA dimethylallyltransferase [Alpinimonas psychrophila]
MVSTHDECLAVTIIAIVGATGTGKSELSLAVARSIRESGGAAEIVNADAMQLYRGMNIGTAKLTLAEREGVPHHLLDVLEVREEAAVAQYQRLARDTIDAIIGRGAVPILVGGSGLYVSSVLFDFDFPGHDDAVRARLEAELAELGPGILYRRLKELAPAAAERIDEKNPRRIVRALEVLEVTGDTAALGTLPAKPVYWRPAVIFGLAAERAALVERLDSRVKKMWAAGLVAEADALREHGLEDGVTARRAIGYAQALVQLQGTKTQAQAIEETQALTRRYARRQVGWFKRYADLVWLTAGDAANAAIIVQAYAAAKAQETNGSATMELASGAHA